MTLIGIQTSYSRAFEAAIVTNLPQITTQPDGLSVAYKTRRGNLWRIQREVSHYAPILQTIKNILPRVRVIGIHGRTATSGGVNEKNVHFFESGGYIFAHNGWVDKYDRDWGITPRWYTRARETPEKELNRLERIRESCKNCKAFSASAPACQKHISVSNRLLKLYISLEDKSPSVSKTPPCDSLTFLKNLTKPASIVSLKQDMARDNFTGVGVLIHKTTNTIFFLSDRTTSVHSDLENYLIAYSFAPQSTVNTIKGFKGIQFQQVAQQSFSLEAGIYQLKA